MNKTKTHRYTLNVYSVRLKRRVTDTYFLTCATEAGPKLFYKREDAVRHKKDLAEQGFKDLKVVKVKVSIAFEIPRKKS